MFKKINLILTHASTLKNQFSFGSRSTLLKFSSPSVHNTLRITSYNSHQTANDSSAKVEYLPDNDDLYSKIVIEVKGHDPSVLESYQAFVSMAASELNISLVNMPIPRYAFERFTLLKSVHVYKKHFRQYEIRTHYRILEANKLTGSTASTFLEYIQRNIPEGVAMKVTKHRIEALPPELAPKNVQPTIQTKAK